MSTYHAHVKCRLIKTAFMLSRRRTTPATRQSPEKKKATLSVTFSGRAPHYKQVVPSMHSPHLECSPVLWIFHQSISLPLGLLGTPTSSLPRRDLLVENQLYPPRPPGPASPVPDSPVLPRCPGFARPVVGATIPGSVEWGVRPGPSPTSRSRRLPDEILLPAKGRRR